MDAMEAAAIMGQGIKDAIEFAWSQKCPDCQAEYFRGHRLGCRWFMASGPIHHRTEQGNFYIEVDPFLKAGEWYVVNPGLPTESTIYVRSRQEG